MCSANRRVGNSRRRISHLPQQADSLPRSRLHVNGHPQTIDEPSPLHPNSSTPTFILTGTFVARKALRECRTASRLRGLTPAAIPVFWLPCFRRRSLPPTYPAPPFAPLNNEASSQGSTPRPTDLSPIEIRDARRIQFA